MAQPGLSTLTCRWRRGSTSLGPKVCVLPVALVLCLDKEGTGVLLRSWGRQWLVLQESSVLTRGNPQGSHSLSLPSTCAHSEERSRRGYSQRVLTASQGLPGPRSETL